MSVADGPDHGRLQTLAASPFRVTTQARFPPRFLRSWRPGARCVHTPDSPAQGDFPGVDRRRAERRWLGTDHRDSDRRRRPLAYAPTTRSHERRVDAVLLFANQSRQLEGRCTPDKSFQRLCANTDENTGTDQAGRHGIHISFNVDRAEAADGHAQLLTWSKRCGWQGL